MALLALFLACVGLGFGVFESMQASHWEQRFERQRADDVVRDQHSTEMDQRVAELERQWAQVQSDSGGTGIGGGLIGDVDLRRHREALAMIDIERAVELAQLQLRLAGSSAAVIDALNAVDARLGRLASPGAARVQAALRHDIARLKAAPDLDRAALAAKLDPLLASVDDWHPSADASHAAPKPPVPAVAKGEVLGEGGWARARAWIADEFGDLVRIREIDTPDALLLGPVQQQMLRDRIRLGVVDLRQAIMARDSRTIHAEANALETLLTRYFDPNQASVASAIAQLQAIGAEPAAPTPMLDETLGALRGASRPGSEG
jgi:uncharacterized protein HemX